MSVMIVWFVGGGVNWGYIVGVIDEMGVEVIDCVYYVCDLYVMLLCLFGFDDSKLMYFYGGCFK